MKTILTNIITFTIVLFLFGSIISIKEASAAETNLDILYENAKNGISDLDDNQMQEILENVEVQLTNKNPENNVLNVSETPRVQTYSTAEIIESNGDTQLISFTTFSDVSLNDNSNWNGSLYDSTGSVRAYATLIIEARVVNNVNGLRLLGTSGGWTIVDDHVKSITNRYVGIGNGGYGADGRFINESWGPYLLTSNTFNRTVNGSFIVTAHEYQIVTTTNATLSTASTSWDMQMVLRFGEPASEL
ncbi:hypothetical protein CD30_16480 [Ureibacillus massiliensis 4400831 = CIP 108448 = CCUG 49529]|uniref:Uncharacterized protein n=1 Tax=Ureibacillus massiliensis 4400831 = CIP 108448 = CCUG 49529 TaxID=1211035 RepID=A0A0A3J2Y0_9BACL|nr:hypothetical protein [Ureibacillus massiliensis]KGR89548.1 hypothetical protein CD30_16480 [Ureibacillus massiliensis 4400831 = CIP 108448 = CCUG 49529]